MLPLDSLGVNASRSLASHGNWWRLTAKTYVGDNHAWPATTSCTGHNAFETSRLLLAPPSPHRRVIRPARPAQEAARVPSEASA